MLLLPDGYFIQDNFLTSEELASINNALSALSVSNHGAGIRDVLQRCPYLLQFANSQRILSYVEKFLESPASLVRAILFNKTTENNWLVPWHQDKTVAVSKRFVNPLWNCWSVKGGVHHVQPPVEVLNRMITLRIHLDDATQENGCLKVIPNSHALGILKQSEITDAVKHSSYQLCEGVAGSALVMRPHLIHGSSKATTLIQRRILHLEFSDFSLPNNITWAS